MLDLIIPRVVVSDNTSIAQSYIIINIIVFVRTISVPFFISRGPVLADSTGNYPGTRTFYPSAR